MFLEDSGIKLSAVVCDITGRSARSMLDALVAGERDPLSRETARQLQPPQRQAEPLTTIPGVSLVLAQVIIKRMSGRSRHGDT